MSTELPAYSPADPPLAEIERLALHWFVRCAGGTPLDAAERAALQAWLAADAAHAAALARWQGEWRSLDALPSAGVQRLRRQLAGECGTRRHEQRQRWAGALLAGLLMAGSWLGWAWWQAPVFAQQFVTARGQQLEVSLPDGSQLRLDSGSRAEVALYRSRREVRLPEGQTVFEVKGDAARPFEVLAGPLRITVVGTRFAVRHTPGLPGHGGASVAVEEGRVQLSARQGPTLELRAGQQIASDATGRLGPVSVVAAAGIAPWREHRLSVVDMPLSAVLAEFERYGPVPWVLRDPAVAALRVSGSFDLRRFETFGRVLPQVLAVRLREQGGVVEIVAR
ncbi:FecR family protein [Roseateles cavernae]|uniref:FecR family protein n=1 Tax=Roseateles cavernae TaxID=3153578 RepID=UPI0032E5004D